MKVFELSVRVPCYGDIRLSNEGTYTVVASSEADAIDALKRVAFTMTAHMFERDDVSRYAGSLRVNGDRGIASTITLIENLLGSITINTIVFDGGATDENLAYFDVSEGDKRRVITFKATFEEDEQKQGSWLKPFALDVAEKITARF